ncbi:MAG: NAD(+) synthase [Lachnospiraceae bacterium]|nr:NAD(+) synthase [Lachnospiraceae bacterium]
MKHGFIKVACVTPDIRVADVDFNKENICKHMWQTSKERAKIVVFPELVLSGYTCHDLFTQEALLKAVRKALAEIVEFSKDLEGLFFIGMPLSYEGELYNTAAAVNKGKLLGFTTKSYLPNYGEFYEMRQFTAGPDKARLIDYEGEKVYFGPRLLFTADCMEDLIVSAEICEDVWAPVPPSTDAALEGATVIVNCSASNDIIGKAAYRKSLIEGQSARIICGYVYTNAGEGESTTDVVFGGHNIIAENGTSLAASKRYRNSVIYSEIDIKRLQSERRKNTTFRISGEKVLPRIPFSIQFEETVLSRRFPAKPFVPSDESTKAKRCEEILTIQACGLKKRILHTKAKSVTVGISGGLDSTLALLVSAKAFDYAKIERERILAVTMPCFGTTDRTYKNACLLAEKLGVTLLEIPIKEAVRVHLRDIGHSEDARDVTYENAQARERTQVLMDLANKTNGMVIGTGDLSELALGWATYNGDHMSMYGVNVGVPKTLVRHLVRYFADTTPEYELKKVLYDVLDTPVSPELLPPGGDNEIAQKTEDIVGPYELHDFFLYYFVRFGYEPDKILRIAKISFEGIYDEEIILKWLKTFCRRFFAQQFKRSCLPDGPKVGTVALSPRGDWRMPSDAVSGVWFKNL